MVGLMLPHVNLHDHCYPGTSVKGKYTDRLHVGRTDSMRPHAGWWKADLPFEGEYDLENVGRTPNVVSGED